MRLVFALAMIASALAPPAATDTRQPKAPQITIDDFSKGAHGWGRSAGARTRVTRVDGEPVLTLTRGHLRRSLPRDATVSFDLHLSATARADIALGAAGGLHLHVERGRLVVGANTRVHRSAAPSGWYRVEAATGHAGAALDGRRVKTAANPRSAALVVSLLRGSVSVRALIVTRADDSAGLLLQRLAWLHTRTPRGKQPIGTGLDGRLRFSRSWTRGFWPGSLWQAYDMTRSPMFKRWAIRATRDNFGAERADTHDLGFMYGRSSAAAYDRLCVQHATRSDCKAFRRSALTAANSLLKLAATNSAVGTTPTSSGPTCTGCASTNEADTIIDSVMNLPLLYWASRVTGDPRYEAVASRHAHIVAEKMVRPDGSTWSSMHNRRNDGAFIRFHTHQGYRDDSTWARGQAWAIYGLSVAAGTLQDSALLDTADRTAPYVMSRIRRPAVPLYDYDAPVTAPHDVSAGVITAAGMLRLAAACEALAAACSPTPKDARAYARGLLTASLARLGTRPPLGFLGHQVYGLGGRSRWDDDAELTFGIDYALEALNGGA